MMLVSLISNVVLIILSAVLIVHTIVTADRSKSSSKQREYTLYCGDKSCVVRLSKSEARAVKGCIAKYTFESGDQSLKFTETKILK